MHQKYLHRKQKFMWTANDFLNLFKSGLFSVMGLSNNIFAFLELCDIFVLYFVHIYVMYSGALLNFSDKISRGGVSVPAGPGLQYF